MWAAGLSSSAGLAVLLSCATGDASGVASGVASRGASGGASGPGGVLEIPTGSLASSCKVAVMS